MKKKKGGPQKSNNIMAQSLPKTILSHVCRLPASEQKTNSDVDVNSDSDCYQFETAQHTLFACRIRIVLDPSIHGNVQFMNRNRFAFAFAIAFPQPANAKHPILVQLTQHSQME